MTGSVPKENIWEYIFIRSLKIQHNLKEAEEQYKNNTDDTISLENYLVAKIKNDEWMEVVYEITGLWSLSNTRRKKE